MRTIRGGTALPHPDVRVPELRRAGIAHSTHLFWNLAEDTGFDRLYHALVYQASDSLAAAESEVLVYKHRAVR